MSQYELQNHKNKNRLPFLFSAPRTRSSVINDLMLPYCIEKLGMRTINPHSELFLEVSRNQVLFDKKFGKEHHSEIYPVLNGDEITLHHVYPYILSTPQQRNHYKFDLLEVQKRKGIHYCIKGTVNCTSTLARTQEFFSDRHWIITMRKDKFNMVMSFLAAIYSGLFHCRHNNYDRYKEVIGKGFEVPLDGLYKGLTGFLKDVNTMWGCAQELENQGVQVTKVYYEDLDSYDKIFKFIDKALGTDDWQNYLKPDWEKTVPIVVEKDYTKIFTNYKKVEAKVIQALQDLK